MHQASDVKDGETYIGKTGSYIATDNNRVILNEDGSWHYDFSKVFKVPLMPVWQGLGVSQKGLNDFADLTAFTASFIVPIPGVAAFAGDAEAVQAGIQFTKSSLRLGQAVHRTFMVENQIPGIAVREFTEIRGIRPDFIDRATNTIYELKPFNPRSIQQGIQQLYKYKAIFERETNQIWNIALRTY